MVSTGSLPSGAEAVQMPEGSPAPALAELNTGSIMATDMASTGDFRLTRRIESFLLRAKGMRKRCALHSMHPSFTWALSASWLEAPLQRLHGPACAQEQSHRTDVQVLNSFATLFRVPPFSSVNFVVRLQNVQGPECNVRRMAVMIPRDCQTKVARAQKVLEEAYNAPVLAPLQNAIIPQDVCELAGNLLDSASWRKLTGIAATCSKGLDGHERVTMNSHVMPLDLVLGALVQRDALQKDETLVLAPTTETAAVQERHPLDHDAVYTPPSDPTSQSDSQTEPLPADCVLEAHTQMSAAQIEDLNSIVQAALEGAVAPLPRGAVGSLARILEATVGAALLTCLLPFQDQIHGCVIP